MCGLLLCAAGCGTTSPDSGHHGAKPNAADSKVSGTVTYRERMMLPPGSSLRVTLEDVSLIDAKAVVLAEATMTDLGAPPYAFTLTVAPGKVDASRRYNVRAAITSDNKLMFTSTEAYPVLTGGNPDKADVVVRRTQM